jgi:hypothetical protein
MRRRILGNSRGYLPGGDERRPMRPSLVAMIVFAVGAASCTGTESPESPGGVVCTTQFVYGLAVTVRDEDSGQRICDAEVVALEGSYKETLPPFGPPDSCTYSGAGERAGVYELRASKAGFRLATLANVRVGADQCHVIPARVTMEMKR